MRPQAAAPIWGQQAPDPTPGKARLPYLDTIGIPRRYKNVPNLKARRGKKHAPASVLRAPGQAAGLTGVYRIDGGPRLVLP